MMMMMLMFACRCGVVLGFGAEKPCTLATLAGRRWRARWLETGFQDPQGIYYDFYYTRTHARTHARRISAPGDCFVYVCISVLRTRARAQVINIVK